MKHFKNPALFSSAIALMFAVSACQSEPAAQSSAPSVSNAQINLPPIKGRPAAGYFTLQAGDKDITLTGVDVSGAERAMLHQTISEDGVSKMKASSSFPVPAGETLVFEAGGKHVMIFGLNDATPEDKIKMTLRFANGDTLDVQAAASVIGAASNTASGAE